MGGVSVTGVTYLKPDPLEVQEPPSLSLEPQGLLRGHCEGGVALRASPSSALGGGQKSCLRGPWPHPTDRQSGPQACVLSASTFSGKGRLAERERKGKMLDSSSYRTYVFSNTD